MPLAHKLAQVTGDRQPRDGAGLAPKGLEGALALAVPRAGRPAPYRERAQIAHSTYGLGEPVVVGNPMQLASGTNRVMLMPDGRRSHTAVDWTDQLISLESAA